MPPVQYTYTPLSATDSVPGRPFTDTAHNTGDLEAMSFMARRLRALAAEPDKLPPGPYPITLQLAESGDGYFRIVLAHPELLGRPGDMYAVGFFGQRRAGADSTAIDAVDLTLLSELTAYPAIVSYSTLRLDDGNFGNLVVLAADSAREHWRESKPHQYAVAELAPHYYDSVRLHNGFLRGGLQAEPDLRLVRTKYYDYRNGFWCGLREVGN